MSVLFSDVIAAEAGAAAPGGFGMENIFILVMFGLIFYFMLIRPQSKRAKAQKEMIDTLQKGDEVVTNGGLVGKISKVGDSFITMTVAEKVDINVQKNAIASALPKGTIKTI